MSTKVVHEPPEHPKSEKTEPDTDEPVFVSYIAPIN